MQKGESAIGSAFSYCPNFEYLQFIKARHNFKNVVFSDIRKANLIFGLCLFCIFVKNTIYELLMEVFRPVLVARYSKKTTRYNFCDIILPYHNLV